MTEDEKIEALAVIAKLTLEDFDTYEAAANARPGGMFDGELFALFQRFKQVIFQ